MATYRQIYLSFWSDPKVTDKFTPEDRYFYLYLLTNPHTNICGCYEIAVKSMRDETGYNEDTIRHLINRMENQHKVIRYCSETSEVLILNWHKYNWTKSAKFLKSVSEVANYIKALHFRNYVIDLMNGDYTSDTVSIPYPYGMDTSVPVTVTDTVSVTVPDIKKVDLFKEFAGDDEELLEALQDFAEMRKKMKKPLATDRAKKAIIKRLEAIPRETWIDCIDQSIEHCWQTIYELHTSSSKKEPASKYDISAEWLQERA